MLQPSGKVALITGVTGQDGSYLAELLLSKAYQVHGICRPLSDLRNIASISDKLTLHRVDLDGREAFTELIQQICPDEIYHLAGRTSVVIAQGDEPLVLETNTASVVRLFEAARRFRPDCRIFCASSSEIFGGTAESPQNELTKPEPRSFYGITKAATYQSVAHYRETYGLHVSSGILYNHESPRRGLQFVTRKITRGAAQIKCGRLSALHLGDLDSARDWGHARDYVRGMWMAVQDSDPTDYVFATGVLHTIRHILDIAFGDLSLQWDKYVISDPAFVRKASKIALVGDASKARHRLGWNPETRFEELILEMARSDWEAERRSAC